MNYAFVIHNFVPTNKDMNSVLFHATVTSIATVKMLLLLLFIPEQMLRNSKTEKEVDEAMKLNLDIKNPEEAKSMLLWIINDSFTEATLKRTKNSPYLVELKKIKDRFRKYYLTVHNEKEIGKTINALNKVVPEEIRACDIHTEIGKYAIQLMRFRMVIQPEIHIAMNTHTQTKLEYIVAKSYWINDRGEKVRKFTKSLGRSEDYPLGKDDPKVELEAIDKIQDIMYKAYKETYPE